MEANQFDPLNQEPAEFKSPNQVNGVSTPEEPVVYIEPVVEPKIYENTDNKKDSIWKLLLGGFGLLVLLTLIGFGAYLIIPGKHLRQDTTGFDATRQSSGYKIPTPSKEVSVLADQTQEEQAVQAINLGSIDDDLKTLKDLTQEL